MSEGYLILNCKNNNELQVELLVKSIRFFDKSRPISIIGKIDNTSIANIIDKLIKIELPDQDIVVAEYFKSLLESPYEKTIAFLPDQILTDFDVNIWENLRGLNSIVLPKTIKNYNNEVISESDYYLRSIEKQTFDENSILNAVYYNKSKGCDYIFGLAITMASQYDQNKFIEFGSNFENHAMPSWPEYIWPEWLMTLLFKIFPNLITKYDFINSIDLSLRENSHDKNWANKIWPEFLSYWINESGSIKIENFVQLGLIKYNTTSWLNDINLNNLRKKIDNGNR